MTAPTADPKTAVIRRARPDDLDGILDGFEAVAAEERWIGTQPGFDRKAKGDPILATINGENSGAVWVVTPAEADDVVVGSGFTTVWSGCAELGMWLLDGWRGGGLGGRLLDEIVGWGRENSPPLYKMELEHWPGNDAAHRLYLSRGFEVEGHRRRRYRRRNGELWGSVLMGLVLDHDSPGNGI